MKIEGNDFCAQNKVCRTCKHSALNWYGDGFCRSEVSPINVNGYGAVRQERTCECWEDNTIKD